MAEQIRIDPPKTDSKIFAHTRWDAIPVIFGILHFVYFFALFYLFPRIPLWVMLILGFIYAVSISWNINGISHNFIHNPYFRSPLLNRFFSLMESVTCCFSQVYYDVVHMQHHKGNSDRKDEHGETDRLDLDLPARPRWTGRESMDLHLPELLPRHRPAIGQELSKRGQAEMRWGKIELGLFISILAIEAALNWRYMIFISCPSCISGIASATSMVTTATMAEIPTNRLPGA